MSNFPSKWFEFLNQKELKRLRKDVNNTFWLKVQISISIIIAIFTLVFSESIKTLDISWKCLLCFLLSLLVVIIFSLPWIIKKISLLRVNNLLIDGKTAATVFDEDIVYNVLVASEYFNIYNSTKNSEGVLSEELKSFYIIEVEYYIKNAIEKLVSFNSNIVYIIGNEKEQIEGQRIINITQMIDIIIDCLKIEINDSLMNGYSNFKANIYPKNK